MTGGKDEHNREISDAERKRRQRNRSIALGLALAAVVIIFYALTVVQFGGQMGGS